MTFRGRGRLKTQHVIAWDEVEAVAAPGGTRGTRHSHDHDHEQVVQVVSGSGTLATEQGEHPFGAGTVFALPAGTWHLANFDSDTVLAETNLVGR